jgi:hypothetical protein
MHGVRGLAAGLLCCASASCGSDGTGPGSIADLPGGASPTLADLFGTVFYRADGSQASLQALQAQQVIGIYFASRSCPACGAFTPQLVSVYNALRTAGKPFEIVMAGVDPASVDLSAYMTQYGMGWLALPLGGVKVTELVTRYNVEWIPTLIVINGAGKTITKNGREDVAAKGAAAFDGWLAASGMP